MIRIANLLHHELETIGIYKDRQNFVPHLTIGRIKYLNDKPLFQEVMSEYRQFDVQSEMINKIILYESELTRQGPIYHQLGVWDLE